MIAGRVHFHDVNVLLLLEGTMKEFSYFQDLYFYKDNIEEIKKTLKKLIWKSFYTEPLKLTRP